MRSSYQVFTIGLCTWLLYVCQHISNPQLLNRVEKKLVGDFQKYMLRTFTFGLYEYSVSRILDL
jgi:hypothetical protein